VLSNLRDGLSEVRRSAKRTKSHEPLVIFRAISRIVLAFYAQTQRVFEEDGRLLADAAFLTLVKADC
jgi:hypothetical protein